MSDIFEDIFDEGQVLEDIEENKGKQLSHLVRELRQVEDEIATTEEYLSKLKSNKMNMQTNSIPALMDEMGIERLDVDGVTVARKMIVQASIPVANREKAFAWLRENGMDDIIKNDVTLSFGKGEDNMAGDVIGLLRDKGFDPKTKTHVHPSTLKAFVKEQITKGTPMDLDLFGAYVTNAAEIRRK